MNSHDKQIADTLPIKLLSFIWQYPEHGRNHVSWAVKDSLVLRGQLENAREKPGLGVAIVITELALKIFGNKANSRIDGCVTWAQANALASPPHLLKGTHSYSSDSREEIVPDFRHSIAFAIILARTGKLKRK
jgi:hypothetical protein